MKISPPIRTVPTPLNPLNQPLGITFQGRHINYHKSLIQQQIKSLLQSSNAA
jgi:hypothetical protein